MQVSPCSHYLSVTLLHLHPRDHHRFQTSTTCFSNWWDHKGQVCGDSWYTRHTAEPRLRLQNHPALLHNAGSTATTASASATTNGTYCPKTDSVCANSTILKGRTRRAWCGYHMPNSWGFLGRCDLLDILSILVLRRWRWKANFGPPKGDRTWHCGLECACYRVCHPGFSGNQTVTSNVPTFNLFEIL